MSDDRIKIKISSDETAQKLTQKISEIDYKKHEDLVREKAKKLGLPYINLKGFPINSEALILIEEAEARQFKAVCFFYDEIKINIAIVDPALAGLEEFLKKLKAGHRAEQKIFLISETSLKFILSLYANLPAPKKMAKGLEIKEQDLKKYQKDFTNLSQLNEMIQQANMTEILTLVVASAVQLEASDIHIEAEEKEVKIRFRLDGVLHSVANLPIKIWPQVVARIKLISGLKINIDDKPQDGRFTIFMARDRLDVRVSVFPTAYGESVVLRLLLYSRAGLSFDSLGLRPEVYQLLELELNRPNGMLLTTGPTGSGKTTTLYAILVELNQSDTKLITIEDPIEYQLTGITQSQIDEKRGHTFAKALRAVVRQDPDIIMIGEIRDLETGEAAVQAALTGHFVLSTVHTNSAAAAVPRLISLGVKPFLLAPALNVVMGQRLVRKICSSCKEETKLSAEEAEKVKKLIETLPEKYKGRYPSDPAKIKFLKGKGCDKCQGIGFKGRIGIFEIMRINNEIRELILAKDMPEHKIFEVAFKDGMLTMAQDGVLKAAEGITSIDEVFRVAE